MLNDALSLLGLKVEQRFHIKPDGGTSIFFVTDDGYVSLDRSDYESNPDEIYAAASIYLGDLFTKYHNKIVPLDEGVEGKDFEYCDHCGVKEQCGNLS